MANKFAHLDKTDEGLERHTLRRPRNETQTPAQAAKENGPLVPKKEHSGPSGFTGNFYRTLTKGETIHSLTRSFRKRRGNSSRPALTGGPAPATGTLQGRRWSPENEPRRYWKTSANQTRPLRKGRSPVTSCVHPRDGLVRPLNISWEKAVTQSSTHEICC